MFYVQPKHFIRKMKKKEEICYYKSQCDIGKGMYKEKTNNIGKVKTELLLSLCRKIYITDRSDEKIKALSKRNVNF